MESAGASLEGAASIARYSVRSDRLFCETLDYNILLRWFLDMSLEKPAFDAYRSVRTANASR
jgi:transposase